MTGFTVPPSQMERFLEFPFYQCLLTAVGRGLPGYMRVLYIQHDVRSAPYAESIILGVNVRFLSFSVKNIDTNNIPQ